VRRGSASSHSSPCRWRPQGVRATRARRHVVRRRARSPARPRPRRRDRGDDEHHHDVVHLRGGRSCPLASSARPFASFARTGSRSGAATMACTPVSSVTAVERTRSPSLGAARPVRAHLGAGSARMCSRSG
jgi:hypothetical protein